MRGIVDEVLNDQLVYVAEWQKGLANRHKAEEVTLSGTALYICSGRDEKRSLRAVWLSKEIYKP
jgi:hypothetical protein